MPSNTETTNQINLLSTADLQQLSSAQLQGLTTTDITPDWDAALKKCHAASVHVLTFTQDQLVEMLLSAYLADRSNVTQMTISNFRNLCNMRLSQEYFRQQREAKNG